MPEVEILINGKTFGDVYFNAKKKGEPTLVKNWFITKGTRFADGYFQFEEDMMSDRARDEMKV